MFQDTSIENFLEDLSTKSATPGGGTVSGLSGALSAALICMVCNLTIGKKRYQNHEEEIKNIIEKAEKFRKEFTLLSEKDAEVFNEVMEAYRLPKNTEEEKKTHDTSVEEATKRAALVPMDVLRRCEAVAHLSLSVAMKGNENAISDAGVAGIMVLAAAQSASLNILINLSTITDEDFISKLKTEQAHVLKGVKDLVDETLHVVNDKI